MKIDWIPYILLFAICGALATIGFIGLYCMGAL